MANWGMIGDALGAALAAGTLNSMHNRELKRGMKEAENLFNPNDTEQETAQKQVADSLGDYIGIAPDQGILKSKENYGLAQNAYNQAQAEYQAAKATNDTVGMQNAQAKMDQNKLTMQDHHDAANMYRSIGKAKGYSMDGYSADDTLQSVKDKLASSRNGQYSFELPQSINNQQGDFDKQAYQLTGTNKDFLGKQGSSNLENQVSQMVRNKFNPEMGDSSAITFEDIDKYAGGAYSERIKSIAKGLAQQRYTDPASLTNLEYSLRDKGYSNRVIADIKNQFTGRIDKYKQLQKENQANILIRQMSALRAAGDYGTANALQLQLMPLINAKPSDYNGYMDKAAPHIGFNNVDAGGQTYISQYDTTGQLPTNTSVVANSLSPNTQYQGNVSERNNIRTNETRSNIASAKNSLEAALYDNGLKGNKGKAGKAGKESRYGYTQDGKEVTKDQATYKTKANNIAAAIASINSLSDSAEIENALNRAVEDIAKLDEDYADNPDTADAHYNTQIYLNNLLGEAWLSKHPGSRYTFYTDDGSVSLNLEQWQKDYKPNY